MATAAIAPIAIPAIAPPDSDDESEDAEDVLEGEAVEEAV